MARAIAIMGESGSGKTTSMRNLDPKSTYYIDCDKKGLSWKGWKTQYNAENKNYKCTNDAQNVWATLANISQKAPHIKTVIIDTVNGIMVGDEMRRAKEKGYDKWIDLAQCIWDMVDSIHLLRDDLTVIMSFHSETIKDDTGYTFTRILTNGQKLQKIKLESKFTTVLLAKANNGEYCFEVHASNSTAKTPLGAYDKDVMTVPNDMVEVLKAMEDF